MRVTRQSVTLWEAQLYGICCQMMVYDAPRCEVVLLIDDVVASSKRCDDRRAAEAIAQRWRRVFAEHAFGLTH